MSDLVDTIWREFSVEAEEHLHLIEQVLVDHGEQASPSQVAQLFRSFHSLKGLGRTLGLSGIEATAHLAENILGVVRDGSKSMDGALAGTLLAGVDALKSMVEHANATRADAPPPESIISLLSQTDAALSGGGSAPAAPVEAESGFVEDEEMLVFFAEALAENLPLVGQVLAEDTPEARAAALEAAEMVAHGAGMVGLPVLRDNAQAVAELLGAETPDMDRLRALIDEMRGQAEVVAELAGTDVGAHHLAGAGSGTPAPREALDQALSQIQAATEEEGVRAAAAAMADAARGLYDWAGAAGRPRTAELFLYLLDTGQRLARGELSISAPLAAALAEAAAVLDDDGRAEALIAELRAALSVDQAQPAAIAIPPELMELLTPEQMAELDAEAGSGRQRLYTVLVFLEQAPDVAGQFIRWLQGACRAVTSRTVMDGLANGFEFLVLSELIPEEFKQQLLDLDKSGSCVREVSALGASAPTPLISPSLRAAENAVQRPGAEAHAQASVIRVRSESIDELVRQIGETLVVANGMGTELARHGDAEFALLRAGIARLGGGGGPLLDMVDRLRDGMRAMAGLHERLDQAIQNLHEQTLELRVVPLDALFTRLLRAARELAQTQDKRVNFQAEGRDVRIDKTIVEQLASPLTHMVRNAIDHGIETAENRLKAGKVGTASFTLSAIQRGNEVTIRLSDDGRGLDEQRILATAIQRGLLNPEEADFLPQAEIHRLIFLPGFSTADKITETSGRGVGMDVVLTTVTGLGGRIDIHSEPGKGTTFSIHLPLSAALQTALLVGAGGQMLAVPERHLTEVRRVAEDEIRPVRGQPCLGVRGALLPVFSLAELLGLPQAAPAGGESASVLVVASGPTRIGLKVDRLYRRQELYMKDLHPRLAAIPGLAGATVLGDGQVVLMLDGEGLIRRARSRAALLAGDAA